VVETGTKGLGTKGLRVGRYYVENLALASEWRSMTTF